MGLLARRKRPMDLGPYPLEKIRRVDQPTTLIIEAEVKRVPRRADGFERARHGDFGEQQKRHREAAGGVRRPGLKAPLQAAISDELMAMAARHDGQVAPTRAPIPDDPVALARNIKSLCYFLNADQVGICEAKLYTWYSHRSDGTPVEPYHQYAVVILIDQGYETLEAASGDDWMSATQSARAYMRGSEIGNIVAAYIRNLGYSARCQSAVESDVQHLPLILLAGLGEMSRIGEVIINPFLGPRFKSAVITTDMPLAIDKPIDFGLQDFCEKCSKCARECPVSAIPFGPKVMYNGYEIWKPDIQNCTSYRISNPHGVSCGRCMKMCPWNKVDFPLHELGRWMAIKLPFMRRFLARLDDWLGYGNRNPVKKWWFDLANIGGRIVKPEKTNTRDNNPAKKPNPKHRIAGYSVDTLPPAATVGPFPYSRNQGYAITADSETPAAARQRIENAGGN
jgi:reductive dehalogenase